MYLRSSCDLLGSLYRFFPNKDAVAEVLMLNFSDLLDVESAMRASFWFVAAIDLAVWVG
ncbi:hypothetical protein PQQ96_13035 [Paraburkholderia sediminicola]|uniref:hypothetical protein n=1 Tax=Paraburkholderia sediminicola TaxID=458836 RepID=UPI0038BB44B5